MIKRLRYLDDVTILRIYDNGDDSEMRKFHNAHFVQRSLAMEILKKVRRWYDNHSDEEIEEHNRQLQEDEDRRALELETRQAKPKKLPKPGVVYLLKCGKYYKIGKSLNYPARKIQLDTQLPHASELIHTIGSPYPTELEHRLHCLFQHKRMNGEWFDLSAQDIQELKEL